MHKFGIIIGRFQPFHNAHREIVRFAFSKVEKLIVVIGSDNQARTIKNPWTTKERIDMIKLGIDDFENIDDRIEFIGAKDYLYNDNMWLIDIQEKINKLTKNNKDIVLIGHKKDKSSFYLNLFPQWNFIETGEINRGTDASKIRDLYFRCDLVGIKPLVPEKVFNVLQKAMMQNAVTCSSNFIRLKEEYDHIENYKEMWLKAPYPPTFVTTDAVVIKSGHILVVRRNSHPGKGLIALPGGFLKTSERIVDGCIRELKKETRIKISKEDLNSKIVDQHVFDHPNRSLRGRTITHAFCINLGHGELPQVKGEDDTDKAWWMPLRDILTKEEEFFEDHFHLINFFCARF